MNRLANLTFAVGVAAQSQFTAAGAPQIQDLILDDHTVYAVPVSGKRITTIEFPGPISAIDGAFVTTDPKTPGLFQLAHTKGTSYFSARALARDAATNLNVRWNGKTYVFELKESNEPWYSVMLQAPKPEKDRQRRPLTPPRLLGLLDKAKQYSGLKLHYPEAVADVEFRDGAKQPSVTYTGDYEVRVSEAYQFNAEDTLVFRLTVRNKTPKPIAIVPEHTEVKVGARSYFPSLAQLGDSLPASGTLDGYLMITGTLNGDPGERNDLSLRNDFTFVLSRSSQDVQNAVRDFEKVGFAK